MGYFVDSHCTSRTVNIGMGNRIRAGIQRLDVSGQLSLVVVGKRNKQNRGRDEQTQYIIHCHCVGRLSRGVTDAYRNRSPQKYL